jgi:predicted phage-related endonuclease
MSSARINAAIVQPLYIGQSIEGTLKFYYRRAGELTKTQQSVAHGLAELLGTQMAASALEEQKKACENSIKDYMETAEKGRCEGYKVSWKTQQRIAFDSKQLQADHPEIDSEHQAGDQISGAVDGQRIPGNQLH